MLTMLGGGFRRSVILVATRVTESSMRSTSSTHVPTRSNCRHGGKSAVRKYPLARLLHGRSQHSQDQVAHRRLVYVGFHDNINKGGIFRRPRCRNSPQYVAIANLRIVSGRFFDDQDDSAHEKVAVIVEPFAQELYGSSHAAVGRTISVKGIPFVIIGVFKEAFNTYGQSEISDHTMLVPYPVLRYFTGTNTLKEIFFTMRDSSMVVPAKDRILEIIRSRHYAGGELE